MSHRQDHWPRIGRITKFKDLVCSSAGLSGEGLDGLRIGQLDQADREFFKFRQFRRSQATCPDDNLVLAFLQFAYQKPPTQP